MIGKKYTLAGTTFKVISEKGNDWIIQIDGEKEPGTISKKILSDALISGTAVEVI